jgi:hypothetical protein
MHQTRHGIIAVILVALGSLQPNAAQSAQQVSKAQAQKAGGSQIRITPEKAEQGAVLAEYLDDRSGRTVTVKSSVSKGIAVAWLTQLVDTAATKPDFVALVTAGQANGLLSVSGFIDGTSVTVSWGPPPKRDPPSGRVVFTFKDQRSGTVLVTTNVLDTDATKQWFAGANAAKTEELLALVETHHSQGLLAVTKFFSGGVREGDLTVTAFWSTGAGFR